MALSDPISVVITTYNRSDALQLVIAALARQTDRDFEVIVADDGSSAVHQERIGPDLEKSGLRASHVWHPDVGFTAGRVRNLGVAAAKGRYLVLMDGDCVPEIDFIARHRALRHEQCFVNGSRVLLSPELTAAALAGVVDLVGRSAGFWFAQRLKGQTGKAFPKIRLPDMASRLQRAFLWKGIRSCNVGVWRTDYERVNGFDETFVGWGHEDADFVLRLHNAGLARKNGYFATEVYHLWHREANRGQESVNAQRVRDRMGSGQIRSTTGYSECNLAADTVIRSWG